MTGQNGKILEVRTDSGELLMKLKVTIRNESEPQSNEGNANKNKSGNSGSEKRENGSGANYEPMTDAQKRYLFRLLAVSGIEKESAHDELKKVFNVDSLKKVTKAEASREIEKRLAVQKGGAANGRV